MSQAIPPGADAARLASVDAARLASADATRLASATRPVSPELSALVRQLTPGQRIRITQRVRVGSTATWTTTVEGTYRQCNYLATGLSTDRVPEDDIVVVAVHFAKDNGELSSVTLDEHSKIELV